jgi:hypothetical protein
VSMGVCGGLFGGLEVRKTKECMLRRGGGGGGGGGGGFVGGEDRSVVSMEEEKVCPVSPHDYLGQNTMQMG